MVGWCECSGQHGDSFSKNDSLREYYALSFTVVFGVNSNLDLIAKDELDYHVWSNGLQKLASLERDPMAFFIEQTWMEMLKEKSKEIGYREMIPLLSTSLPDTHTHTHTQLR
jgi:hypothetical protein